MEAEFALLVMHYLKLSISLHIEEIPPVFRRIWLHAMLLTPNKKQYFKGLLVVDAFPVPFDFLRNFDIWTHWNFEHYFHFLPSFVEHHYFLDRKSIVELIHYTSIQDHD